MTGGWGSQWSPYPGFLAPASLKPNELNLTGDGGLPYPGFLAPASLKRWRDRQRQFSGDPLSGVSCPGLIEARLGCDADSHLWLPYPGFLAPASLKQGIQADRFQAWNAPYPGFLAPASLKRGLSHLADIQVALLIRGFLPRPH